MPAVLRNDLSPNNNGIAHRLHCRKSAVFDFLINTTTSIAGKKAFSVKNSAKNQPAHYKDDVFSKLLVELRGFRKQRTPFSFVSAKLFLRSNSATEKRQVASNAAGKN